MTDADRAPLSSWLSLGALGLVSVYAVIDRQVFVLLAEPIRRDMGLSDTQLGLLQGVALTLIGVITIYPIAWAADRFDRRRVTAGCIMLWSLAVLGCAAAPDFAWLLVFASFVGIGEAAIGPTSYAMIPDLFSEKKRQLANSIYAVVARIGISAGAALTGLLIAHVDRMRAWLPATMAQWPDWRLAFIAAVIGMPVAVGLLLALPRAAAGPRGASSPAVDHGGDAGDGVGVMAFIRHHAHVQIGFFMAMMLAVFGFAAVSNWVPIIAARDFGQPPAEAGAWLGSLSLASGGIGFLAGTLALQWLQPRTSRAMPMRALGILCLAAAISAVPIALARSSASLYLLWGVQLTLLAVTVMLLPTVLQNMSPRHLRARLFAVTAMSQLIAGGLSPVVVGAVSDAMTGQPHALLVAACGTCVLFASVAAFIFWRIAPSYAALVAAMEDQPNASDREMSASEARSAAL